MQRNEIVTVEGMSCAFCYARVEKELSKSSGITSAGVNIATEKATVLFDDSVISIEDIYAKIEGIGYGVIKKQIQDNKSTINIDRKSALWIPH